MADWEWSYDEIKASVEAYLEILSSELAGLPHNKAATNRKLREGPLSRRTKGAVEMRMCNISSVLNDQNLPFIDGYKPRSNVGPTVTAMVLKALKGVDQKLDSFVQRANRVDMGLQGNHSLALIVAYYLSKFDRLAYEKLGLTTSTETHAEVGRILGVNPNTVKNMRDEFDPLHDNPRAGWYQRPLRPSRAKVVESFQHLLEEELRDIVLEILTNPEFASSDDFSDVVSPIAKREKKRKGKSVFIVRGPTGKKAEEHFIAYHANHGLPQAGELKDTRDQGCGYDFALNTADRELQVEVKGLDGDSGGITFTSKEWDTARSNADTYYLVIVRNVSAEPDFQIIKNPYKVLSPKISVFSRVQVGWNVSESGLPAK